MDTKSKTSGVVWWCVSRREGADDAAEKATFPCCADEFAKSGALQDGAEFAEEVAKGADKVRKQINVAIKYAATFHCEVENLVAMEEITEEMKQKPKWRLHLTESEGLKHRMVKAAEDKKLYQCLGKCNKRHIYNKVLGVCCVLM